DEFRNLLCNTRSNTMTQELTDTVEKLDKILSENKNMGVYCKENPKFAPEMLRIFEVDYQNDSNLIYINEYFDEYYDVNTDTYDLIKIFLLYLKYYNMGDVHCNDHQITSIPVLPKLINLHCSSNKLQILPVLPQLTRLQCARN